MKTASESTDIVGAETLAIIASAHNFNKWMYNEIRPYLRGRVLEVGSGTGNISRLLLDDKFKAILSDYNPSYLNYLQTTFADYYNLEAVLALDLQDPLFGENNKQLYQQFDTVFLLNVIEHLKDDLSAVSNCKYLIKPGGRLILLAPAYTFLYCNLDKNLNHQRRYTIRSLARLLTKNQLMVVEKKYFNLAGIVGWLVWGKIIGKRQLKSGDMKIFNTMVPFFRFGDKMIFKKMGLSAIVIGEKK